jgi:hypothetical protein
VAVTSQEHGGRSAGAACAHDDGVEIGLHEAEDRPARCRINSRNAAESLGFAYGRSSGIDRPSE